MDQELSDNAHLHRRRRRVRLRERGRAAMVRGVHVLPSLATLGNAVCGFAAMYVATLTPALAGDDPWTLAFARQPLMTAAYLLLLAAFFDAIDGFLARATRQTTDFGGQLDSLADVISFGCAPALLGLLLFRQHAPDVPLTLSRLVWGLGAIYVACAALRLARFNVAHDDAQQAHRTFDGLPSPAAGLAIASLVLAHEQLRLDHLNGLAMVVVYLTPLLLLAFGLLMVSVRPYPHLVNTLMKGRRGLPWIVAMVAVAMLVIVEHRYVLALGCAAFAIVGPLLARRLNRAQTPHDTIDDNPTHPADVS